MAQQVPSDPRKHRHVVKVEGDTIRYRCGCLNTVDQASGILCSVEKCKSHSAGKKDPASLGLDYYRELGTVTDSELPHQGQIEEALGPFPMASGSKATALEIGCGVSPYVPAIRKAGYKYLGLDPSPWAAQWMAQTHIAPVLRRTFEDADLPLSRAGGFTLILAAHVFEHLQDAPGAILKAAKLLQPGGELWVIVPDDSDPLNPDHLFFFNAQTLRKCLEAAGLVVERLVTRKYVKHEHFLYARARKP